MIRAVVMGDEGCHMLFTEFGFKNIDFLPSRGALSVTFQTFQQIKLGHSTSYILVM